MVLLKGPAAAALKPAVILSVFPFAIGASGLTGVVHPHEAVADSITTGLSVILEKSKLKVTGTPCLILPKSCTVSLNLTNSSAFTTVAAAGVVVAAGCVWANTPAVTTRVANANTKRFMCLLIYLC